MHHTAWTARSGAPGPVTCLAQTPDGWLWVGTPAGLFRFDGLTFERVERLGGTRLASDNIFSLAVDAQGGLWIGHTFAGVSHHARGELAHYGEREGLRAVTVFDIAQRADGSFWLVNAQGLMRLAGGRWERVFEGKAQALLVDRSDALWFVADRRLFHLRQGESQPVRMAESMANREAKLLTLAPDGSVWAATSTGYQRFAPSGERSAPLPRGSADLVSAPALVTRSGVLWAAHASGVLKLDRAVFEPTSGEPVRPLAMKPFTENDGLSGPVVHALLEDREGNVWVGTLDGLDRFRHNKLTRLPTPSQASSFVMATGRDGGLWLGAQRMPLMRVGDTIEVVDGTRDVSALAQAPDGDVWIGTFHGELMRLSQGRLIPVVPPGGGSLRHPVLALAVDGAARVWMSLDRVYWLEHGEWRAWTRGRGEPDIPAFTLHRAGDGRVWVGQVGNRLSVADGERAVNCGPAQGLGVGNVLAVEARGRRVWVGGDRGVALLDGERFHTLVGVAGTEFRGVSGVVESRGGDLWINDNRGVVRISAIEVERFAADHGHVVSYERFNHHDGLDGTPVQVAPVPSAAESTDGRLWFALSTRVASIDPKAIARNALPPLVHVRGLKAGDRLLPPDGLVTLPPNTRALEVQYQALSLTNPQRVRFRYRLQGVDAGWQDAGDRRAAYYTNLEPGRYRFEVTAANDDGVWSDAGAALDITIDAAPHQTLAFRLAIAAAAIGLLAVAFSLRSRRAAALGAQRMRDRQRERDHIAADLHDTFLQGIYALVLRLQGMVPRIPAGDPVREDLERTLDQADRVIADGRDRVVRLRGVSARVGSVSQALESLAQEVNDAGGPQVAFRAKGHPRPLAQVSMQELYLIGTEAVMNAVRHSQARRIELVLEFHPKMLRLVITDDGVGIDAGVLASGSPPGHWGLTIMKERAADMGGWLSLSSMPGRGSKVELCLPAAVAYTAPRPRWPGWRGR